MTNEEMLTDLIVSANQSYLEQHNVTLARKDLTFSGPTAGEFENGNNTMIRVTAHAKDVEGSYDYHYKRLDMQQAFTDLGVGQVSVDVKEIIGAGVLNALRRKYNFILYASEVETFIIDENVCTITVVGNCLVWIGTLTVYLVEQELEELSVAFPNNILNGLDRS